MYDKNAKLCQYTGCHTRATFGTEQKKPIYCAEHRQTDMIDVVNRICNYPGCKVQARFGLEPGQVTRCGTHKSD